MSACGNLKEILSCHPAVENKTAVYCEISPSQSQTAVSKEDLDFFESIDAAYRALCAILFNYAPNSGHPGGSISSGRFVQQLLFSSMDYDFSNPGDDTADIISYAAGHKAMGLYALWAIRNELVRIGDKSFLADEKYQLRFEDLLGFRRNPVQDTALFKKFNSKALDGHPSTSTPFVKTTTGASGVGVGSALGLALGALDYYAGNPPNVHIIEGEGGMTAGRVHEALASAATGGYKNAFLHLDWNQASIDSNKVCRDGKTPGDYVQWTPAEILLANDWNVVFVPNGHDFGQIACAQKTALSINNGQPTAIVYRTVKGWKYGIEGKGSHGAGHKFGSEEFYKSLTDFQDKFGAQFPKFCGDKTPSSIEECFWENLLTIRNAFEKRTDICKTAAKKLSDSKARLKTANRKPRANAPIVEKVYTSDVSPSETPAELQLKPGQSVTLRGQLSAIVSYLNKKTDGAFLVSSADLSGSTNVAAISKGFADGFFHASANPKSRMVSIGGICEDSIGAVMTGLSGYGRHIGVSSSYAAFIAALEHIPARLHCIGQQNKHEITGKPYNPFIMINAHAGVKTGEDGPTHADPQPLQLLQENFPKGTAVTLTPWDPQEIWPLFVAALKMRFAVIAPFVTRPEETLADRNALGIADISKSVDGVYPLVKPNGKPDGVIVMQGNGVASIFVNEVLAEIKRKGINIAAFYVSSAELFNALPEERQNEIFPPQFYAKAMGMTDFTLPTMHRWIKSVNGLKYTMHPFMKGHFLGSGAGSMVLKQAGMDARGQMDMIENYLSAVKKLGDKWY